MAENSWPFDNADTTETQFAKWAAAIVNSGVLAGLVVTVSSGLGLSLAVGSAIVRGVFYENTTAKALTVGTAHATLTRKDAVVLKVDLAANTITAYVKAGTATSSGGTLPTMQRDTNVYEWTIAEITVPPAAVNLVAGNVATKLGGVGLRVTPYPSAADRPTPDDALALGVNTTLRTLELWTAGSWYSLTPDINWGNLPGKPSTFAPSAHSHAAADVTSGTFSAARIPEIGAELIASGTLDAARLPTVPLTKGGTGQTTALAARAALRIFDTTPTTPVLGDIRFRNA